MEEMQTTEQYVQANTEITITEIDPNTGDPIMTEKPEEKAFTKFLNGLSDLLLEHDDFNYNIVRSAAELVTDDFDIEDHFDIDEVRIKVQENLDMYDLASDLGDYLDYDDIATKAIREMDMSEVASEVRDYFSVEEEIDSYADKLLNDYDPTNGCGLGAAFTNAVAKAVSHMFENSEDENFEVMQFLMNRNAIVMERVVDSDRNVVEENIIAAEGQTFRNDDNNLTNPETFVPSEIPATNVQEHAIEALKRVVHEVFASYIPTYNDDPFMKVRLEAKAFDTFTDYMNGKW